MTTHKLKSWPSNFQALKRGEKTFEIRENDRDFKVGDLLIMQEFVPPYDLAGRRCHPHGHFTGNQEVRWVTHILKGDASGVFGLDQKFVVMGLRNDSPGQWRSDEVQPAQTGAPPIVTVGSAKGAGAHQKVTLEWQDRSKSAAADFAEEMSASERAKQAFKDGLLSVAPEENSNRSLTDHERELLDILSEECAEVIIQISKLKRFGRVGIDSSVSPAMRYDNIALLGMEVGHLQHMIHVVQACELIYPSSVVAGENDKGERLLVYLQTKRDPVDEDFKEVGE